MTNYVITSDGQLVKCEVLATRKLLGFWNQKLVLWNVSHYLDGKKVYESNHVQWMHESKVLEAE